MEKNEFAIPKLRLSPLEPQQTLSRLTLSFLVQRFFKVNVCTMMQNLISKPQHSTCLSFDGQGILRDIAASVAVTDLAHFLSNAEMLREIQLRRIVQHQHWPIASVDLFRGSH